MARLVLTDASPLIEYSRPFAWRADPCKLPH